MKSLLLLAEAISVITALVNGLVIFYAVPHYDLIPLALTLGVTLLVLAFAKYYGCL
ncbi:hypothetical protein IPA_07075 [Ignicoccus pacificus DSM 13166]|uniref:Uncharacterized protein n=1 Tax=Ignicoccus pacificus DSM 13166 TaxID=940294 RepID=A0A977KBK8_9CREN|nr:hypothetical protein IPA_07075 [Ignicoccus pacificus DSM 13166]